jgi:hypothetical protein
MLIGSVPDLVILVSGQIRELAKRHEISRTLIRVWLAKHEAGVLDSDRAATDMLAPACPFRWEPCQAPGPLPSENNAFRRWRG